ncbi:hypothetical protein CEXT_753851 [Caerostris extrusa]|uniref:Uncharacterized protein n=1 Tax=Caerostris extrusa TaxID=172846 RepID=A0AAV4VJN8_CAEEX|nr:hypothetical protein CEXT_753851 [Caerostris extrusa]
MVRKENHIRPKQKVVLARDAKELMASQEGLVVPGGTFFGIGETILNGSKLTITSDGGIGGRGQDGGDGYGGKSGCSIDVSSMEDVECRGDHREIKRLQMSKDLIRIYTR